MFSNAKILIGTYLYLVLYECINYNYNYKYVIYYICTYKYNIIYIYI